MSSPVQEGDLLAGKYKIGRVLAKGGMGVVVSAMHEQLEQRVALKFLLPEGVENEATLGRFLREAKAAVRLRSEHVARVLDVGSTDGGAPYIVMEYLEGSDLEGVLRADGRLPIADAVTYVLQAAEAVAEAHALGIVHRDLKPANLFLTRRADGSRSVKVLDFGISKISGGAELSMTKTTSIMGTPYYMSPEQLRSSKMADCRSDIWSFGMILYELVTGAVAFERDTLPELCSAILFEPAAPPRQVEPSIPASLEACILRALEKEPAARFQTLAAFAAALAPFAPDGEQMATRVRRVLGAAADAPEPPAPRPSLVDASEARTKVSSAETLLVEPEPPPSRAAGLPDPRKTRQRAFAALAAAVALVAAFLGLRPHPAALEPAPASLTVSVAASQPAPTAAPTAPPTLEPIAPPAALSSSATPPASLKVQPQRHPAAAASSAPDRDELYGPRK